LKEHIMSHLITGASAAPRWPLFRDPYRHPECARCARYARTHLKLDWRGLLEESTAAPPCGPLRMGEVVVQDLASGALHHGACAMDCIARAVPLYAPLRLLLCVPAVRRKVDAELGGCGAACELPRR
jgi:hypothetical protein